MVAPINYMLDVKNPIEEAVKGYQLGASIQKNQLQRQQLEQKQKQAQQMQIDLGELSKNPDATAEDIFEITTKYPDLADHFKKSWEILNAEQQQNKLSKSLQIETAIRTGNTDVAKELLQEQITAAENSGIQREVDGAKAILMGLEHSPETALTSLSMFNAAILGPDKYAENREKMLSESGKESKREFDRLENELEILKSKKDLAKTDKEIEKLSSEIKTKENELKVEEKDRIYSNNLELNTIMSGKELLADIMSPENQGNLKAATGALAIRSKIPGSKARTMAGKISRLQNLLAKPNLDSLKGAMSDKDLIFLKNIESNLDLYQDEDSFYKELVRLKSVLENAEKGLKNKIDQDTNNSSKTENDDPLGIL